MSRTWLSLVVVLVCLGGCRFETLPDPNRIVGSDMPDAGVMQANIRAAHIDLGKRVAKGEITEERKGQLITSLVDRFADSIDVEQVPKREAWRYADVLRQADRWEEAYELLTIAVEVAPNTDRQVNDSLQKARVAAHLGKMDEAFELVRSTFDAVPEEKAPIMMATLYEITPEALGQGRDVDVAKLLVETIEQANQVVVDPETEAGKNFLLARPQHVTAAWRKVMQIIGEAGDTAAMREALDKKQAMEAQTGSF